MKSLPPLVCGIYNPDGTLATLADLPDPREAFCAEFNRTATQSHTARPLDGVELEEARRILAEGKGVTPRR